MAQGKVGSSQNSGEGTGRRWPGDSWALSLSAASMGSKGPWTLRKGRHDQVLILDARRSTGGAAAGQEADPPSVTGTGEGLAAAAGAGDKGGIEGTSWIFDVRTWVAGGTPESEGKDGGESRHVDQEETPSRQVGMWVSRRSRDL